MKRELIKNLLSELIGDNKKIYFVLMEDGCIESEKWISKSEWIENEVNRWSDEEMEDEYFFGEENGIKLIGGFGYGKYREDEIIEDEIEVSEVVKNLELKGVMMIDDFEYCLGLVYVK